MRLKTELYAVEQARICQQVIDILGLDERNSIRLSEVDADKDKQRRILELIPDIRAYFSYTLIQGASYPTATARAWLSIAKCVTKSHYDWHSKDEQISKKRSRRIFLTKKSARLFPENKNLTVE